MRPECVVKLISQDYERNINLDTVNMCLLISIMGCISTFDPKVVCLNSGRPLMEFSVQLCTY